MSTTPQTDDTAQSDTLPPQDPLSTERSCNQRDIRPATTTWRVGFNGPRDCFYLYVVDMGQTKSMDNLKATYKVEIALPKRLISILLSDIVIGDGVIAEVFQSSVESHDGPIKAALASIKEDPALSAVWSESTISVDGAKLLQVYRRFAVTGDGGEDMHVCIVMQRISMVKVVAFLVVSAVTSLVAGLVVGELTKSYDIAAKTTGILIGLLTAAETLLLSYIHS